MNIHLLTYLTNRIFWFYTVYRYNSALYVKEKIRTDGSVMSSVM